MALICELRQNEDVELKVSTESWAHGALAPTPNSVNSVTSRNKQMSFLATYLYSASALLACLVLLWILSVILVDTSIIDPFWGPGFFVVSIVAYYTNIIPPFTQFTRAELTLLLVTCWGFRLGAFLLWRHWGEEEDFRYKSFRRNYGPKYWWFSFLFVFLLQGTILLIVALPVMNLIINHDPTSLGTLWDIVSIALVSIGLFFESLGDLQLAAFKSNSANQGKVLKTGLWGLTRHPNYFGDSVVWWGLFALNMNLSNGLWMAISPVIMTFLLMKVSGVAMLERSLKKRKPEYEQYCKQVPAFFPKLF